MSYSIAIFSFNKHQDLLPYALKSIKKNAHGYEEIVVVWDDFLREREVDFNEIRNSTGVDFRVVKHTELYDWPDRIGRWGWIKQQLAKLLCYQYINSDYTWIFDGDVLLTGDPELFDESGKPYLRYDPDETICADFIPFMEKYLGFTNFYTQTWVGSTALFDHKIVKSLWQSNDLIHQVNDMLTVGGYTETPFSEFEIYGNYAYNNFGDSVTIAPSNWGDRGRPWLPAKQDASKPIQVMWNRDNTDSGHLQKTFNRLMG